MRILLGCVLMHLLVASLVGSPWWVPNLTMVGLVFAVATVPSQWLVLSGVAAVVTTLLTVRMTGLLVSGYLLLGWGLQVLATLWDLTDLRVQCLVVGTASLLIAGGALLVEGPWTPAIVGALCGYLAITCVTIPLLRWVFQAGR